MGDLLKYIPKDDRGGQIYDNFFTLLINYLESGEESEEALERVIKAAKETNLISKGFWGNSNDLSDRLKKQIENLEKGDKIEWAKLSTKISWLLTTHHPFYKKIKAISPIS